MDAQTKDALMGAALSAHNRANEMRNIAPEGDAWSAADNVLYWAERALEDIEVM